MTRSCMECQEELKELKGYYICDRCKIVHFANNTSPNEKEKRIKDYIATIQKAIREKADEYHDLEQRHTVGKILTEDEDIVRKNLWKFNDIRTELELLLNQNDSLKNNRVRELLYRLLMISDWLETTFEVSD